MDDFGAQAPKTYVIFIILRLKLGPNVKAKNRAFLGMDCFTPTYHQDSSYYPLLVKKAGPKGASPDYS